MKKWIAMLLALTLLLGGCSLAKPEDTGDTGGASEDTTSKEPEPTWMTLPAGRTLSAKQYFVYNCETGEFLTAAEDVDTKIFPASVTKLFTAYIALQYLRPGDSITAGDVLDKVVSGSSVAEIQKGDTLTVAELVAAMLLPSGNDAAYILAAAAGQVMAGKNEITIDDAVRQFVAEMNAQAKLLGMKSTHFANPDGIHSDSHYTSYHDLAIMGTLAMGDPTIMTYAKESTREITLASGTKSWKNTNELINPESQYYCPCATGLKTGQTPRAGSCLLSSFEYKGQTLLVGVFGCAEAEDRFPDTLQLFTQAVNSLETPPAS